MTATFGGAGTGVGLGSAAPTLGTADSAAAAAAQQAQINQQLFALHNSPYGDSPLFRNLKQVWGSNSLKKILDEFFI